MPRQSLKPWIPALVLALIEATAACTWLFRRAPAVDKGRAYTIGYGNDRPMNYVKPDGTPGGIAVELVQRAAAKTGIKLVWVPEPDFHPGQTDMWVLYTIRPDRLKTVHFTEPYPETQGCFIVKEDSTYHDVSDLANARVGINRLGLTQKVLAETLPHATQVITTSNGRAVDLLAEGAADAAFVDEYNIVSESLQGKAPPSASCPTAHQSATWRSARPLRWPPWRTSSDTACRCSQTRESWVT
jgi:ABC-type amino acid transport substrate-binding protein